MGAGALRVSRQTSGTVPTSSAARTWGGASILTGAGNLLGIPFGGQRGFGIRPYALIGAGVMRASASFEQVEENSSPWGYGGGIAMFFGTHVGVRFDFRYFRTFDDVDILGIKVVEESPGKLDFTRTSLGLVFHFERAR